MFSWERKKTKEQCEVSENQNYTQSDYEYSWYR